MIINKYNNKDILLRNIDNMIMKYDLLNYINKYSIIDKNNLDK